jgi:hypothetical protein
MSVPGCGHLRGGRSRFCSARPPIEADFVHSRVVDDGLRVCVVYDGRVYSGHRRVVIELATVPVSAGEADAEISKPIVDAAIEPDFGAPISRVPEISAVRPAPIPRSPIESDDRRQHPRARHPEIPIRAVGPVAWNPYVPGAWANGLHINGNHWRSDRD